MAAVPQAPLILITGGEPGRVDRVKESIPMGRGGQPDEVARAIGRPRVSLAVQRLGSHVSHSQSIDAPCARAGCHDVQKHETPFHGQFSTVEHGEEAVRRMPNEVSKRHFAG